MSPTSSKSEKKEKKDKEGKKKGKTAKETGAEPPKGSVEALKQVPLAGIACTCHLATRVHTVLKSTSVSMLVFHGS